MVSPTALETASGRPTDDVHTVAKAAEPVCRESEPLVRSVNLFEPSPSPFDFAPLVFVPRSSSWRTTQLGLPGVGENPEPPGLGTDSGFGFTLPAAPHWYQSVAGAGERDSALFVDANQSDERENALSDAGVRWNAGAGLGLDALSPSAGDSPSAACDCCLLEPQTSDGSAALGSVRMAIRASAGRPMCSTFDAASGPQPPESAKDGFDPFALHRRHLGWLERPWRPIIGCYGSKPPLPVAVLACQDIVAAHDGPTGLFVLNSSPVLKAAPADPSDYRGARAFANANAASGCVGEALQPASV